MRLTTPRLLYTLGSFQGDQMKESQYLSVVCLSQMEPKSLKTKILKRDFTLNSSLHLEDTIY